MAIQALTNQTTTPLSSGSTTPSATSTTSANGAAPTENMFLQLLVAQLKNQDPSNPTDSTQFVTQLAQFSELEQVMGIRTDIESYHAASTTAASTTTPANGTSTGTTSAA